MSRNISRNISLELEDNFEEMSEDLDLYGHLRRVLQLRLMELLDDLDNAIVK
jgi:hypothetical protein